MPSNTQNIHHLGLAVKDLNATSQFFTEILQWEVVQEVPDYPAKFVSNGQAFITLWQTEKAATPFNRRENIGLHHFALRVDSEQSLNTLFTKIQSHPDVIIEFPPTLLRDGPAKHCMFYEPGGIRMELIWLP